MSLPSLVAYGGDGDSDESDNEPVQTRPAVKLVSHGSSDRSDDSPPHRRLSKRKQSDAWDEDEEIEMHSDFPHQHSPYDSATSSPKFVEPPPPPGHSNSHDSPPSVQNDKSIPKTYSLASLSGYEEEDSFTKYDKERKHSRSSSRNSSPPIREEQGSSDRQQQSPREERDDTVEASVDAFDVDQLMRQAQEEILRVPDASPAGSNSPMPGTVDDADYVQGPEMDEGPVEIPSDAEGDPDPAVAAKFVEYFDRKAAGADFNKLFQKYRSFTNPSAYVIIKERFDIDEKRTNFPKSLYDPDMFPENCFYDKLAEAQNRMMEHLHAQSKKKKTAH